MCNCKKEIEKKLIERYRETAPEASGHEAELTGYTLIIGDELKTKGCMPIKLRAKFPLKKGGDKERTSTQNMIFTFCPFCGQKYA